MMRFVVAKVRAKHGSRGTGQSGGRGGTNLLLQRPFVRERLDIEIARRIVAHGSVSPFVMAKHY
jgi:hypothetical protein